MKRRTKCYIYTSVSTSLQVDGYNLDAQKEKLRKHAEYEDMTIVGEYSDEGFSSNFVKDVLDNPVYMGKTASVPVNGKKVKELSLETETIACFDRV